MIKLNKTIGIIGVGLLGSAMAERLLAAGFKVLGCDVEPARLEALRLLGGEVASDAATVLSRCERVLLSLPSHREVGDVMEACASALHPGLVVIDTTTGDPATTEELARVLSARGVVYLDATISGSSAQARTGEVVLMVGGAPEAFAACTDLLSALGRQAFHTGPAGSGAKMKLVTNLVLGLNRAALAEGLAFADSFGLDLKRTLEVMRSSAAYSRIMDSKGERMISGDFTPDARLSQHLKDVRLIVDTGRQSGLPMPFSTTHRSVLESAEAAGCGDLDNSAIIRVLTSATPNGFHP